LTQTGDILGTIRYMAPERFRGEGDGRADVYALGLTLYELLNLKPAFDSPDRLKLIERIKAEEPPRPRALDPRIPRDLETIVLKAIEKDPKARYPSADALGEDLRRFLAHQPVRARGGARGAVVAVVRAEPGGGRAAGGGLPPAGRGGRGQLGRLRARGRPACGSRPATGAGRSGGDPGQGRGRPRPHGGAGDAPAVVCRQRQPDA